MIGCSVASISTTISYPIFCVFSPLILVQLPVRLHFRRATERKQHRPKTRYTHSFMMLVLPYVFYQGLNIKTDSKKASNSFSSHSQCCSLSFCHLWFTQLDSSQLVLLQRYSNQHVFCWSKLKMATNMPAALMQSVLRHLVLKVNRPNFDIFVLPQLHYTVVKCNGNSFSAGVKYKP